MSFLWRENQKNQLAENYTLLYFENNIFNSVLQFFFLLFSILFLVEI